MNSEADFHGYREWKGWSAESFGSYSPAMAAYYEAELARTRLDPATRLDVLELGFGNGRFAGWARSKGFAYAGSELNPDLLASAAAAGFRTYDSDLGRMFAELGPESLDLVVAFDVLEHLELDALESLLESIRQALRPGGCLLARVPSGDSPFGRAVYHGDLTHRLALGSSAVRQLAVRHGFHVEDIGPPRLPLRGAGLRRAVRRALVLAARKVIGRVINAAFHHNQPRVITSNLVFVLSKPGDPPST
jgi:SAM-dependent methyltransferase